MVNGMGNDGHFLFNHMMETVLEYFCKYESGTAMQISYYCNTVRNVRDGRKSFHGIVDRETSSLLRRLRIRGYIKRSEGSEWVRTEKLEKVSDCLLSDPIRMAQTRRRIMERRFIGGRN